MDIGVLDNRIAIERRIYSWHPDRGLHCRFQNEIVNGDFRGLRAFAGGFQFLACGHERASVDVDVEIEMRNRAQAFDEPLRNNLAHARELNTRAFASLDRGGGNFLSSAFCFRPSAPSVSLPLLRAPFSALLFWAPFLFPSFPQASFLLLFLLALQPELLRPHRQSTRSCRRRLPCRLLPHRLRQAYHPPAIP